MPNGQVDLQGRIQEVRNRVERVRPGLLPQAAEAVKQRVQSRQGPLSEAGAGDLLGQVRSGGSKSSRKAASEGGARTMSNASSSSSSSRGTGAREGGHRSIT